MKTTKTGRPGRWRGLLSPKGPLRGKTGMTSRIITVAICLFWLGMTTALVWDRVIPGWLFRNRHHLPAKALIQNWQDIHEYNTISYRSKLLGASGMAIERRPNDDSIPEDSWGEYDARISVNFKLKAFGVTRDINWRTQLFLNPEFQLDRFRSQVSLDRMQWEIFGYASEKELRLKVLRGGQTQYAALPLEQPISLRDAVAPTLFRRRHIRVGDAYSIQVFDPLWNMSRGEMLVEVLRKETILRDKFQIETFRVEARLGDLITTMWVTADGKVLRRELMAGLLLDRIQEKDWPDLAEFMRPMEVPPLDEAEFKQGLAQRRPTGRPTEEHGITGLLEGAFPSYDRN